MGLRAINNPKSSFEDPYSSTGNGVMPIPPPSPHISATGGSVATSGDYKIHSFTSPGNFVVAIAGPATCGAGAPV